MLFVGADPAVLRPTSSAPTLPHPDYDSKLWLCQGRRTPFAQHWPQLRTMR